MFLRLSIIVLLVLADLPIDAATRQELEEALKIRRELAQKNPETYLPDLAQTLSTLGRLDYSNFGLPYRISPGRKSGFCRRFRPRS
jgi:hypothetical protein